jgi:hypothetical protein
MRNPHQSKGVTTRFGPVSVAAGVQVEAEKAMHIRNQESHEGADRYRPSFQKEKAIILMPLA